MYVGQSSVHSCFEGAVCLEGAAHASMIMKIQCAVCFRRVTVCRKHGAHRSPFQPGQGGQGSFSVEVLFEFDLEG